MNSSVGIHTKVQIRFLCINIFTLVPSSKNVPNQKDQLEDRSKVKISSEINALFFYRSQNILSWSTFFVSDQKFITYCASHKRFVPNKKRWFAFSKKCFCACTKVFEEAVKFLVWLKKFRLTQNILEPVKGQSKSKFEK